MQQPENPDQVVSGKTMHFYSMHPDIRQAGAGKCGHWE